MGLMDPRSLRLGISWLTLTNIGPFYVGSGVPPSGRIVEHCVNERETRMELGRPAGQRRQGKMDDDSQLESGKRQRNSKQGRAAGSSGHSE